jgi:hypothetical protein
MALLNLSINGLVMNSFYTKATERIPTDGADDSAGRFLLYLQSHSFPASSVSTNLNRLSLVEVITNNILVNRMATQ